MYMNQCCIVFHSIAQQLIMPKCFALNTIVTKAFYIIESFSFVMYFRNVPAWEIFFSRLRIKNGRLVTTLKVI